MSYPSRPTSCYTHAADPITLLEALNSTRSLRGSDLLCLGGTESGSGGHHSFETTFLETMGHTRRHGASHRGVTYVGSQAP